MDEERGRLIAGVDALEEEAGVTVVPRVLLDHVNDLLQQARSTSALRRTGPSREVVRRQGLVRTTSRWVARVIAT